MATTTLIAVVRIAVPASERSSDPGRTKTETTIEQNKATARRWSEELWSKGNLAVADEIIAADYVRHDPGDPFPAKGPDDVKRIVTMLRSMDAIVVRPAAAAASTSSC